ILINGNKSSGLFKPAVRSLDDHDDGSKFERSRNADTFILESNLKWIPYDKFKNVEYLSEGGISTIYKAIWSLKSGDKEVALKSLNSYLDKSLLINELIYHANCLESTGIINLYGYTKDPDTSNYLVVMKYANKGDLRRNIAKVIEMNWEQRLHILHKIISGLYEIHSQNLIHRDFHYFNILCHNDDNKGNEVYKIDKVYITDFGLCQPVKSFLKNDEIYGILPYIAPEILRRKSYTSASDIYSFSMIMWEFTSRVPPFYDMLCDDLLSIQICKGKRPEIIENTPQCYTDLMKRCWNEDPLKRPSASEIRGIIGSWIFHYADNINDELKSNIMEFINTSVGYATESHPQTFSSRVVNEILESEDSEVDYTSNSSRELPDVLGSEDFDDCISTSE
ncbi:kinase-like domain-containing protein, partial [Rhizophagus diaphanus]